MIQSNPDPTFDKTQSLVEYFIECDEARFQIARRLAQTTVAFHRRLWLPQVPVGQRLPVGEWVISATSRVLCQRPGQIVERPHANTAWVQWPDGRELMRVDEVVTTREFVAAVQQATRCRNEAFSRTNGCLGMSSANGHAPRMANHEVDSPGPQPTPGDVSYSTNFQVFSILMAVGFWTIAVYGAYKIVGLVLAFFRSS